LLDIAPTVLDLAVGLEAPSWGRSLRPVYERREREDREVMAHSTYEDASQSAVIDGNYKLVKNREFGVESLFDLAHDPMERSNLIDEHPEIAARLSTRLALVSDAELNDVVLSTRKRRTLATMCEAGVKGACVD
jgi:arylsulfatase A-like enzyme